MTGDADDVSLGRLAQGLARACNGAEWRDLTAAQRALWIDRAENVRSFMARMPAGDDWRSLAQAGRIEETTR